MPKKYYFVPWDTQSVSPNSPNVGAEEAVCLGKCQPSGQFSAWILYHQMFAVLVFSMCWGLEVCLYHIMGTTSFHIYPEERDHVSAFSVLVLPRLVSMCELQ